MSDRPDSDDDVARLAGLIEQLRRRHGFCKVEMSFGHAVTIIAQLQLALRHPDNTGPSAKEARQFVEDWIVALDEAAPGIANFLNMGWNPMYDVRRDGG